MATRKRKTTAKRKTKPVDRWEQGAVKHPGAVEAAAKREGLTVHQWAMKHQHDKGTPAATLRGRRARLALLFERQAKAHGRGIGHYHGEKRKQNPVLHEVIEVRYTDRGPVAKVIDKLEYHKAKAKLSRMKKLHPDRSYRMGEMKWEDRLKRNPDRLHDAIIVLPNGKRVKGKAKYDSKSRRVRTFVPEKYAH